MQRRIISRDREFDFIRGGGVPAVLQACRESRHEFLEPGDVTSLERRREAHPLYKLYFQNEDKTDAGIYFCAELDCFWGMRDKLIIHTPGTVRPPQFADMTAMLAVTGLDQILKNLAVPDWWIGSILIDGEPSQRLPFGGFSRVDLMHLIEVLPCLETLTLVVTEEFLCREPETRDELVNYDPEINGELDDTRMSRLQRAVVHNVKGLAMTLKILKKLAPQKNWPKTLKFRFDRQMMENEGFL
ncbi:uncharacterized protein LY89DRAFT_687578 [Mollisia scopiformis]|uniref:Uncharacterized protein n=1 Tax=Mollisia scopiformis TaxID=149040 RepID=A0A194WZY0_MOLSC|nr:uncharacterized protein LY89DRAFT_687578 [Mollisia scopiformis]KUJ13506.1 hypothetical protein LY89DRAFT_687578 [Mollisia scopiformis]